MTDSSAPDTDIPTHPEEMKTNFDLRVGKSIALKGSARITPAGIVTTGLTILAVAVAWSFLASGPLRRR